MEETIQITKISVKDGRPEILFTQLDYDKMHWNKLGGEFKSFIHPDLRQALDNLKIHLALLSDLVGYDQVKTISTPKADLIKNFHINGFSLTGEDDKLRVVITGTHDVLHGSQTLNTPTIWLNSKADDAYKHLKDLKAKIERVQTEAISFLDGTKRGTDPQQSLFDSNNGVQKAEVEETEEATA